MPPNYFIGVVSLAHAQQGYEKGITQACHGKKYPLAKMQQGDWMVQYSPKTALHEKTPYQQFTYLGYAPTGKVYPFAISPTFHPYRMKINWLPTSLAQHTPIGPLITKRSLIKDPTRWGYPFRVGFFPIPAADFALIYQAMTSFDFDPLGAAAASIRSAEGLSPLT